MKSISDVLSTSTLSDLDSETNQEMTKTDHPVLATPGLVAFGGAFAKGAAAGGAIVAAAMAAYTATPGK